MINAVENIQSHFLPTSIDSGSVVVNLLQAIVSWHSTELHQACSDPDQKAVMVAQVVKQSIPPNSNLPGNVAFILFLFWVPYR